LALAEPAHSLAQVAVTTVHSFVGTDGKEPLAGLVLVGGSFYGTTSRAGTGVTNPAGTVFRMTPAGDVTTLYTFDFQLTGDTPFAGVIDPGDGKLYGTTRGTGAYLGNVFRVGSGFLDLHAFSGYFFGQDGSHSEAGLALGDDGKLYGTTTDGGASNVGTVFRVATDGTGYVILHSFTGLLGPASGFTPRGGLVKGSDGNFYGTTGGGSGGSAGTLFRITPAGALTTIHTFVASEGSFPTGTLVHASDDMLYGTTSAGGAHGAGTVYRVGMDGSGFANLHSFDPAASEGSVPSGVIEASDGYFYGTTSSGGASYLGTVFVVTPNADFATVASFALVPGAGYSPRAPLAEGPDGYLYGTTVSGGAASTGCPGGCGTVFKVALGLPPTTTSTSSTSTSTSSSTTSSLGATTSTVTTPPPTSSTTSTTISPVTTSTAAQLPASTTTTLPPNGCAATATFASVRCRIEALRADVNAETGLGAFGPKLSKNLEKALAHTDDAFALCDSGNAKKAKSRLAQVKKALTQYVHRLKGLAARKKLDATLRAAFVARGEAIVPDATALRGTLACPADAVQ
jgi:uncharacterized repeat protein (TIGR03803 family)